MKKHWRKTPDTPCVLSGEIEFAPLEFRFGADRGGDPFLADNLLMILPRAGHPLKSGTTYLVVLSDRVRGANGKPLQRSAAFEDFWAGNNSGLAG